MATDCLNIVLEQEKNTGEEISQSQPLIFCQTQVESKGQKIPGDLVHKGHLSGHKEKKEGWIMIKGYKQRIPIQLETAGNRSRVRISEYQDLYHFKC